MIKQFVVVFLLSLLAVSVISEKDVDTQPTVDYSLYSSCDSDNDCIPEDESCTGACVPVEPINKPGGHCHEWGLLTCSGCNDLLQCDENKEWRSLGCPEGTFCKDGACSETTDDHCRDNVCIFSGTCGSENNCSVGLCTSIEGSCNTTLLEDYTPCGDEDNICSGKFCLAGECISRPLSELEGERCAESTLCADYQCQNGECVAVLKNEGSQCNTTNDPCLSAICSNGECVVVAANDLTVCESSSNFCEQHVCVSGQCVTLPAEEGEICDTSMNDCYDYRCINGTCSKHSCNDENPCGVATSICEVHLCQDGECVTQSANEGELCKASTDPCSEYRCNDGKCAKIPSSNGTVCKDAENMCGVYKCSLEGFCEFEPANEGSVCAPSDNPCIENICQSGACLQRTKSEGEICKRSNDTCVSFRCLAGVCLEHSNNEGNPCKIAGLEVGVCQEALCEDGECVLANKANETVCGTSSDPCKELVCIEGVCITRESTKLQCAIISSPCQEVLCDESGDNCAISDKQDGTLCGISEDVCTNLKCYSGQCIELPKRDGESCGTAGLCKVQECWNGVCELLNRPNDHLCGERENGVCKENVCLEGECIRQDDEFCLKWKSILDEYQWLLEHHSNEDSHADYLMDMEKNKSDKTSPKNEKSDDRNQ